MIAVGAAVDPLRRERRAMRVWTGVIVGLLVSGIFTSVGGALIALHGRPVVESDFYTKALHWDDQVAMRQASMALGWKTEVRVGTDVTTMGSRALTLRLTDRAGAAVDGATVSVAFFHRARPLDMKQLELKSVGDGIYGASAPINQAGVWEFRVTIRRPSPADGGGPREDVYVESLNRDFLK